MPYSICKRDLAWALTTSIIALVTLLLCAPAAQAVTVEPPDMEATTLSVLEACYLDYKLIDDLQDDVSVTFKEHAEPYWERYLQQFESGIWGYAVPGAIVVRTGASPQWLNEIIAHEWSHEIWFSLPWAWKLKWKSIVGEGDPSSWYTDSAENFAECMRCGLWPTDLFVHTQPRTQLPQPAPDYCRAFIDDWRWGMANPFADLGNEDEELKAAAGYLWTLGVFQGYPDRTLRPYGTLLVRHVALIAQRLGLECSLSVDNYSQATRGQVRDAIPGLEWREKRWDETLTRGQLARLLYRMREKIDAESAQRLEQFFSQTWVEWKGKSRQPRLRGYANVIVAESRKHCVPLWLALGQCWRESQWFTTGLSVIYNCGWGIKDPVGRWGDLGSPAVVGDCYANYESVEEAIRAYFRLMDSPLYRSLLDAGEWRKALNKYAPAFENDTAEHWQIVTTVKQWLEKRGIR